MLEESGERARAAVRAVRQKLDLTVEERVEASFRTYFEMALDDRELFEVFRRNAGAIAADQNLFEPAIGELFEDLDLWAQAGDIPRVNLDYVATASAGLGFQIATHLIDRDPPDVDGATAFCTRFFLGGVRAVAEGGSD
jgi:hypothetical protein